MVELAQQQTNKTKHTKTRGHIRNRIKCCTRNLRSVRTRTLSLAFSDLTAKISAVNRRTRQHSRTFNPNSINDKHRMIEMTQVSERRRYSDEKKRNRSRLLPTEDIMRRLTCLVGINVTMPNIWPTAVIKMGNTTDKFMMIGIHSSYQYQYHQLYKTQCVVLLS